MGRSGDETRTRIVRAAEDLFAANGIDSVSLREVMRVAEVRNTVSVQYHFTDRAGVVAAILEKHRPEIEARRHAILDELEASGDLSPRQLAVALVRPWAWKLNDADGGRAFLQINHELIARARAVGGNKRGGGGGGRTPDSYRRWTALARSSLARSARTWDRPGTATVMASAELARRARARSRVSDQAFVANLIDVIAAVLVAPVSAETARAVRAGKQTRKSSTTNHN